MGYWGAAQPWLGWIAGKTPIVPWLGRSFVLAPLRASIPVSYTGAQDMPRLLVVTDNSLRGPTSTARRPRLHLTLLFAVCKLCACLEGMESALAWDTYTRSPCGNGDTRQVMQTPTVLSEGGGGGKREGVLRGSSSVLSCRARLTRVPDAGQVPAVSSQSGQHLVSRLRTDLR